MRTVLRISLVMAALGLIYFAVNKTWLTPELMQFGEVDIMGYQAGVAINFKTGDIIKYVGTYNGFLFKRALPYFIGAAMMLVAAFFPLPSHQTKSRYTFGDLGLGQ